MFFETRVILPDKEFCLNLILVWLDPSGQKGKDDSGSSAESSRFSSMVASEGPIVPRL